MPLSGRISPYARQLTALFVEDDAATRTVVASYLKGVFKELILARDGEEGLRLFQARQPDLVLTDNWMPNLAGIAMVEAIRALDERVPVVFLTASMDTTLLVRAINLGIASFIPKPVQPDTLVRALEPVVKVLQNEHLRQLNVRQELDLLHMRERYHEHQQELAFRKELSILEHDFEDRLFRDGAGAEWLVQAHYQPHDIMCGDSYSMRRLGDGSMLLFLADAMGKGLSAALSTALAVHTFNLEVEALDPAAPFGFNDFAERYLRLVARRLLEEEVLAMTLAWLPAKGGTLQAASFGMPPVLALHGTGVRRWKSGNPPASAYLDEVRVHRHGLEGIRALLLHTDGLGEAAGRDGALYRERLDAAFAGALGCEALRAAFQAEVPVPDDDVTFLALTRIDGEPAWRHGLRVPARLEAVDQACLDLEDLLAERVPMPAEAAAGLATAIREAVLNAYEHGSLGLTGLEKRRLLEEDRYEDVLLEREQGVDLAIDLEAALRDTSRGRLLEVRVRDQGPGFQRPLGWRTATDHLSPCGRGLRLMARYSDALVFNEPGNQATLLKLLPGPDHADRPDPAR